MWRTKWHGVISDGLRSLLNLMPNAYEGNQIINVMLADPWTKDDLNTMCAFAAKTLRKMESEGHIKWNYMDAVCNVLENTKMGTLGQFIPEVTLLKIYGTSDSTLTLYNKSITRSWETMWNEYRQIWSRHISHTQFSVKDGAMIAGIYQGLIDMLDRVEPNRGNPGSLSDQIVFISSMNEKKANLEETFTKVRDEL